MMRLVLCPNGYSGLQLVNAKLARAGEGVVLVRRGPCAVEELQKFSSSDESFPKHCQRREPPGGVKGGALEGR